jgi:hypothetical protein
VTPASIGARFSTGNAILYTDDNGIATTAYIPRTCHPTNGHDPSVLFERRLRACGASARGPCATGAFSAMPNQTLATITVVADPLSVTIGSNESSTTEWMI